jgi:hypothetical protein
MVLMYPLGAEVALRIKQTALSKVSSHVDISHFCPKQHSLFFSIADCMAEKAGLAEFFRMSWPQ